MATFRGYLFSKLAAIGSKSEGPRYYLQQPDYTELVVQKKAELWEKDPTLHPHLDSKVVIEGELSAAGIVYSSINAERSDGGATASRSAMQDPAGGGGIVPLGAAPGPNPIGTIEVVGVLHAYRMILFGNTAVAITFGPLRLFIDYSHATVQGTTAAVAALDGKTVRVTGVLALADLTAHIPHDGSQVIIVAQNIVLI
jgi:hypothetical protein